MEWRGSGGVTCAKTLSAVDLDFRVSWSVQIRRGLILLRVGQRRYPGREAV